MPVCRHESTLAMMLACDSITPFGRPAVPEVKQIVASVSGAAARISTSAPAAGRKRSTVAMPAPAGGSSPARSTTIGGTAAQVAGLAQRGGEARGLDDDEARLGVRDAPREVAGVVVDVERHDDEPEAERREVDRHPAGAVARGDRDAVARSEPLAAERGLPARDVAGELAPR